jgi:5-methylcytosine-specific restriction enzyme subunit McrC
MILTVLEHEKIYIGKKRDIAKKQISKADAESIRIIDINNKGIFKWGNRYITPQQWVGVISLPGLSLEILPKISNSNNDAEVKETLLYMFKIAYNIPTKRNINAKVDFSKNGLVEILISNYLEKIEYYIREGFLSSYRKVVNNITTVKGSVVFSKHINKNVINPTRFFCKYSKLDIDNNVNQLIKYTMIEMKKISKDFSNIKRLNTALIYFDEVSQINEQQLININIQITRINSRIKEIIEYSNLFLEGYTISLSNGKHSVTSMLFDMNKIFEMFIFKSYKKICGSNISYQYSKNYLISNKTGTIKKVKLKPDILINTDKGFKIVVDAKWKVVKSFAKESDVYQMNAYISAIPKVNIAILMYPKTQRVDTVVGDYTFINVVPDKELKIRAVDLSIATNETLFKKHLRDLLT